MMGGVLSSLTRGNQFPSAPRKGQASTGLLHPVQLDPPPGQPS